MKKIIVLCLTISVTIGIYGHSKNNSKQPYVTVVLRTTPKLPPEVAGEKTDAPISPTPSPKPKGNAVAGTDSETIHPTEYQILMGKKNGPILWKVYTLESTRGKHDSCRAKGKFNGFGYIPGNCYDFFEEVAYRVDTWFTEKLETHSLAEALCGYNLGFQSRYLKDCINKSPEYPYYRNYENL